MRDVIPQKRENHSLDDDWTLYEKLPGETKAAWPVADCGPCESRWSAERAARR